MHEIVLTESEAGLRLDRYVRKLLRTVPLDAIFRHIRQGAIRINGEKVAPDLRLVPGMRLQIDLPPADIQPPQPPPLPAPPPLPQHLLPRVVRQDEQILVVAKPSGLAVHGGSGQKHTLVDWLASQRVGVRTGTFRPSPAHRLDRGTSGLMVIGLTPDALRALTAAFREGRVQKVYWAVVHGIPERQQGAIAAPLYMEPNADRRDPKVRVDERGEPARTEYEVVRSGRHLSLLRVTPREGKQHQIRAHLAFLGHPIVGDDRYGSIADMGHGFMLHAGELTFPHPRHGKPVACTDPLPPTFLSLLSPE